MSAACPVCNRRQDDGIMCHACTCTIEYELGDPVHGVPAIVAELDTTLARQGRGEPAGKGGLAHERVGFHTGASIAADDLANALTYWAKTVTGVHPSVWATTAHPIPLAARMLLDNIPAVRAHHDASTLHSGVLDAVRQARHATDRAANRTIIPVGPCPEEDENGTPCPGEVFAFIPTEDDRPSRMECKANPVHKWTSVQFYRTGARIKRKMDQQRGAA